MRTKFERFLRLSAHLLATLNFFFFNSSFNCILLTLCQKIIGIRNFIFIIFKVPFMTTSLSSSVSQLNSNLFRFLFNCFCNLLYFWNYFWLQFIFLKSIEDRYLTISFNELVCQLNLNGFRFSSITLKTCISEIQ